MIAHGPTRVGIVEERLGLSRPELVPRTGPHQLAGPSGTIPATGRAFSFPYVDVLRARDGKFVSHRIYRDNVTFLAQLGLMPNP